MLHEAISPSRKMKILKIKIFFFFFGVVVL